MFQNGKRRKFSLYEFIRDLKDIYTHSEPKPYIQTYTAISGILSDDMNYLRGRFCHSADLTVREIRLSGINAAVISIDNMIDKQVLAEGIMTPLMKYDFRDKIAEQCYNEIKYKVLYTADMVELGSYEEVEKQIMSGFAVIAIEGCKKMLGAGIQGYASRGISEPESDVVQRGSKEGFVESVRVNMSMLRRRIKNPSLYFETMVIGDVSRTEICICYLKGTASEEIVDELKRRLKSIDINTVLTSGYLVPFLEEKNDFSFFSGIGVSERPDTVCGKITEGRIAVLVDGVPSVLIVPYLFAEYFQTLDDYSNRAYFATFTRLLKYCAFFISMLLPGVYVALGTFDPEMFPTLMLNKIAGSIGATPLSLMSETILIQFVYEMMREAGLRMPQPLGYAVSIVGGLVVGDTAINAGLIGAPTLMVVAITSISSYVIPNLYAPSAILRLIFTFAGGFLGIWGVAIILCVVLVNICGKNSFGVPYTTPITPFSAVAMRDVIIRAGWKILSKKTAKVQNLPGADVK